MSVLSNLPKQLNINSHLTVNRPKKIHGMKDLHIGGAETLLISNPGMNTSTMSTRNVIQLRKPTSKPTMKQATMYRMRKLSTLLGLHISKINLLTTFSPKSRTFSAVESLPSPSPTHCLPFATIP
jgi:hypothetical protein